MTKQRTRSPAASKHHELSSFARFMSFDQFTSREVVVVPMPNFHTFIKATNLNINPFPHPTKKISSKAETWRGRRKDSCGDTDRESENGMKQRIRSLVSLHEIPFSSCAPQRKEGNWPHYTKRGGEGGECVCLCILLNALQIPHAALRDCCPTCNITFINTIFFALFSLVWQQTKRGGGVTLALKPAIVLPPGQPANQATQSQRERRSGREGERKDREGEMVAMVTSREMRAHLFICRPRERARRARCACAVC